MCDDITNLDPCNNDRGDYIAVQDQPFHQLSLLGVLVFVNLILLKILNIVDKKSNFL